MQPSAYPVYEPMWDYFQQALLKEAKRLAEDIAESLGVPDKPLKEALAKKRKPCVYLVEMTDPTEDRFQCEALLLDSPVAKRCRSPVVYGDRLCPCHIGWRMPDALKQKPAIRRLVVVDDDELYFVDNLTQMIYDVDYKRVGTVEDTKAFIFEIEGEEV